MKLSHQYIALYDIPNIKEFIFGHSNIDAGITFEDFQKNDASWYLFLLGFLKDFTPQYVAKMVKLTIDNRLAFIRTKREMVYKLNDELRLNGTPAQERIDAISRKIKALGEMEADIKILKKILPAEKWITPSDVRSMKFGMERFFNLNLDRIII